MTDALSRLVGETGPFLAEVFGRHPVHVAAADPSGFHDLLSLDDVDHLIASTGMRAPAFRLVRDGETLPRSSVTRHVRIGSRPVDDLVDVAAVHREFDAGASVVLQGLHRSFAPVATLCRSLEHTLTHPVQANAYLTPPVAQGLHLHADPHDVFAVQTHGAKRWVVHPPSTDEAWDLELQPGDVLYLPAGTRHAAQTVDQPSLHLTIGVRTTRWRELVRRAVDLALDDLELDESLPAGWAHAPETLTSQARAHLATVAETLTIDEVAASAAAGAARSFWRNRPPDLRGGIRDLLELDDLGDTTPLRVRADASCQLETEGTTLRLVLGDRELHAPAAIEDAVRRIVALGRLVPKDLDELIDEPSRRVLCRRLVREGLLTVDRGADHVGG